MPPRRIPRRRILAASAGAAAAFTLGAVVRRYQSEPSSNLPGLLPTATAFPRGGTLRLQSPTTFAFDTFDTQRTAEPSVLEVLARTNSRLIDWVRFDTPVLGPSLATSWEQPSAQRVVLHLNPAARWEGAPSLTARPVLAEDIVRHFDRARTLASAGAMPAAQRPGDYALWERVTAPDSSTVVIETSGPDPFVLHTLAGRYALTQAPEAVAAFENSWAKPEPSIVFGTGAFVFTGQSGTGALTFTANRNGHLTPNLDALEVHQPGTVDDLLAGRTDEYLARDRREAPDLRSVPGLAEYLRYEDSPIISTFAVGAPPWNNPDLVRTIQSALNRYWLATALFGGRSTPSGPVSPASGTLALSPSQLARYPGYATDPQADAKEAVRLWRAADGPSLGTITIDFPNTFDPRYNASATVVARLNDILGPQFRAAVETYPAIAAKVANGEYGNGRAAFWFGWGPPLLEPDPTRMLLETYRSGTSTAAQLGITPSNLNATLDALANSANIPATSALHAAQHAILQGSHAVVTWCLQTGESFRRKSVHASPPTPFWTHHLDHLAYRDQG